MTFGRGPPRFVKERGVSLRRAKIEDSLQLISLNKAFRSEMMQWEAGFGRTSPVYPVLDIEDLEYILNEEEESLLVVLLRKEGSFERLLGYSYAYIEPWESDTNSKPRKQNRGRIGRTGNGNVSRSSKDDHDVKKSLYIAELFVMETERGCGYGELLLWQTLRQECVQTPSKRSHLFVSSRNLSAVKCYQKFGFVRSHKPSGDQAHDVVMELDDTERSVSEGGHRLDHRMDDGTVERRSRPRSSPVSALPHGPSSDSNHRLTPEPVGSPSQHSPRLGHHGYPSKFGKDEDIALAAHTCGVSRPSKNYSSACKRLVKQAPQNKAIRKVPQGARDLEVSGVILGDLFEINTRHHGGYERKLAETAISLRSDPSFSSFPSPALDGHRRKKRDDVLQDCMSKHVHPALDQTSKRYKVQNDEIDDQTCGSDRRWRFLLTGYPRVAVQRKAEDSIRRLGGEVCVGDEYDPTCTHVVSPLPLRTEKFLCGLAAGKHLVHSAFVDQSAHESKFLPVEGFEWFSVAASSRTDQLCQSSHELTKGLLRWSEHRSSGDIFCASETKPRTRRTVASEDGTSRKCFGQMSVVLFISSGMLHGVQKLLKAGGSPLCLELRDVLKAFPSQRITHALVSMDLFDSEADSDHNWGSEQIRVQAMHRLKDLYDEGVHCLRVEYLMDLLVKGPSLSADEFVLNPRDFLNGKKRKRDGVDRQVAVTFFESEPVRSKKAPMKDE